MVPISLRQPWLRAAPRPGRGDTGGECDQNPLPLLTLGAREDPVGFFHQIRRDGKAGEGSREDRGKKREQRGAACVRLRVCACEQFGAGSDPQWGQRGTLCWAWTPAGG